MAVYEIINVGANKALNISGSDLKGTSLYDNRNVALWTRSGSGEQAWILDSKTSPDGIRSYLNRKFGLNAYRNSTSKYKCDIHTVEGNETDSDVTISTVSGGYKIKLKNYNMYLTADGTSNGASVSWAPSSTSNLQVWKLNEKDVISFGDQTTLYGAVGTQYDADAVLSGTELETNAKYIYDFLRDAGFTKQAACAALGNFEAESTFNPAIWEELNVYTDDKRGYGLAQWSPGMYFLQWAKDVGFITSISATAINSKARTALQDLMDAELAFLMWTLTLSGDNFTGATSFDSFKKSTGDVKTLAKTFAQNYERPASSEYTERQNNAQKWYNFF